MYKRQGVVDAGVFPLVPASHLQAVVYGVAEKVCFCFFSCRVIFWVEREGRGGEGSKGRCGLRGETKGREKEVLMMGWDRLPISLKLIMRI